MGEKESQLYFVMLTEELNTWTGENIGQQKSVLWKKLYKL